jgi:hypothetical protein
MAEREDIQPDHAAATSSNGSDTTQAIAAGGLAGEATNGAAKLEPPEVESPAIDMTAEPVAGSEAQPLNASHKIEPRLDVPYGDAAKAEMPKRGTSKLQSPRYEAIRPSHAVTLHSGRAESAASPARNNRFMLLAASVAIAAAFGAVAGAIGANGFAQMASSSEAAATTTSSVDETAALQATIGKLRTELASLRASVDAANKTAHGQYTKIAERFERVERAQTERNGKLAKAVEGIERLEKKADPAPAKDITGSVNPPAGAAAGPLQPPIVPGWVVRDVYRGVAVLQGRRLGIVEVERGDVLPGVGRIEAFKKQGGHRVVVTSSGLITTSMR